MKGKACYVSVHHSTGTTIIAWINYQAKEPIEVVLNVIVRDIARILTPDHVPFVYEK
jgi:hypothetical protein